MSGTGGLALARCDLHPEREASARCLECGRDYCRECVVDHHGRLLCRRCLARLATPSGDERGRGLARRIAGLTSIAVGFFVAWLAFYSLGRLLLLLPTGVESRTAAGETR